MERQAEADRVVQAAVADAERLGRQAQDDPARWVEAVAAAAKADELAQSGVASPGVCQAAAHLRRDVEAGQAAADRDRRLLAALLDVGLPGKTRPYRRDEGGRAELAALRWRTESCADSP